VDLHRNDTSVNYMKLLIVPDLALHLALHLYMLNIVTHLVLNCLFFNGHPVEIGLRPLVTHFVD